MEFPRVEWGEEVKNYLPSLAACCLACSATASLAEAPQETTPPDAKLVGVMGKDDARDPPIADQKPPRDDEEAKAKTSDEGKPSSAEPDQPEELEGLKTDRPARPSSNIVLLWTVLAAAAGGFIGAFLGLRSRQTNRKSTDTDASPSEASPLQDTDVFPGGDFKEDSFADTYQVDQPADASGDTSGVDTEAIRIRDYLREHFGEQMGTLAGVKETMGELSRRMKALSEQRKDQQLQIAGSHGLGFTAAAGALDEAKGKLADDPDFLEFASELRLDSLSGNLAGAAGDPDPSLALLEAPWSHDLLRAEALCQAYYPTAPKGWELLRFALTCGATALRAAVREQGWEIGYVRLLTPQRPGETERVRDERLSLQRLSMPPRILAETAARLPTPLVVDCLRFGRTSADGEVKAPARVVVYNPAEWI